MYTGDDCNYDRLILGDAGGYSDALLGIFDAIAPAASAALQALDRGDVPAYRAALEPTVPLARHIFQAPTHAYKTGLLAWTGGDVTDPDSWHKVPRPWFTGGGHACVVDTPAGSRLVYHRKLSAAPGWADREIRWTALGWDGAGYPVAGLNDATAGPAPAVLGGLPRGFNDGLGRVA